MFWLLLAPLLLALYIVLGAFAAKAWRAGVLVRQQGDQVFCRAGTLWLEEGPRAARAKRWALMDDAELKSCQPVTMAWC